jgi:hypothetical protein
VGPFFVCGGLAESPQLGDRTSCIFLLLLNYCEYFPLPMIRDICVFR